MSGVNRDPGSRWQAMADAVYGRYRDLVPDWSAFLDSLGRPLPTTVWAHPVRIGRGALQGLLAEAGLDAEPVPWHPGALTLAAGTGAGGHWGYYAGLYQSQEAVAMVPVVLLDPRPGERVLDMCAAPGNKTAQIALAMANEGTVHANEIQRGRLAALRSTIKRLGLANVTVTTQPGQDLALANGPFDRILVDAPCSGEGIWRKVAGDDPPRGFHVADAGMRRRLVRRQHLLLARAVRLTRVGGRIVYATCTLAPEENEMVLDRLLRECGDQLAVRPARLPGFAVSAGVTRWAGQRLHSALAETARVWPHQNDTGGFFVAVLERIGGCAPESVLQPPTTSDDEVLAALAEHYAVPATAMAGLRASAVGGRYLNLVSADHRLPPGMPVQSTGLPVLGLQARPPKPTTAFALGWGGVAAAHTLELDAAELSRYLLREPLYRAEPPADAAYVLVRHRGHGIGVARVRGRQADGRSAYASLHPKAWATASA